MTSSLFRDVTRHRLIFTDVSGSPIRSTQTRFKYQSTA